LALRLLLLGSKSLWLDEARSLLIADAGVDALWAGRGERYHPPLYYFLVNLWGRLGRGEFTLRLSSALLGTAAIWLTYAAARRLASVAVGLSAAWLAALSPLLIWYAQEFRSYALLTVLGLAAVLSLVRLITEPRWTWFLLYATCMALALYTHYTAVLLLPVQLLVAGLLYVQGRAIRRGLLAGVLAAPVIVLLYWPWLRAPAFGSFLDMLRNNDYYSGQMLATRLGIAPAVATTVTLTALAALGLAALATVALLATRGQALLHTIHQSRAIRVLLLSLMLVSLAVFVYPRAYSAKRLIVALWPFALMVVAWFWPWERRYRRPLALLLGASLLASLANIAYIPKDDWRGTVAHILANRQPNDAVWILPGYHNAPFDYYGQGSLPITAAYPGLDDAQAVALLDGHDRVWLVEVPREVADMDPARSVARWLDEHLEPSGRFDAYQIRTTLYTRRTEDGGP
jgi:uncharacterized membrane protein